MSEMIELGPNSFVSAHHITSIFMVGGMPKVMTVSGDAIPAPNYANNMARLKTDIESALNGHTVVVHNINNHTAQQLE